MAFMILLLAVLCVCPPLKAQERSCSALLAKNPSTPSGEYTIDPDGLGRQDPFKVQCDMSQDGGVTILSHDSENRTHVFGFNKPGSYKRVVNYTANPIQVERLTRISVDCTQSLIYECLNSKLSNFAWWVSRDGEPRRYWGDTEGDRGPQTVCQCKVLSTCTRSLPCNCDANDHIWRQDGGDLIFKPDLPVIELRFGDTENDTFEQGYHILGKLRCHGQNDINDCDINPCLNGGSCVDLVNDFECDCEPGYTGTICQTDIDECASNPCTGGQVCTDEVNGYSCTCPSGQTCANAEGQSGEDGCGSYCILIILLSLCIGIGILCIIVIASGIKYVMG